MTSLEDAAATLGAETDRRWRELDVAQRLPEDIYLQMAQAGILRQLLPREVGGMGRSTIEWFDLGLELARYDGSLGWIATQGNMGISHLHSLADRDFAREVIASADVRIAGTNTALGVIDVSGPRRTISGRWSFTSGCEGADWIAVLGSPGGVPNRAEMRFVLLPVDRFEIERDWDVVGLRGTGSHTVVADTVPFDPAQSFDLAADPVVADPARITTPAVCGAWAVGSSVAATQLGIARRALDETLAVVEQRAPAPAFTPLLDNPAVQRELSRLEGRWRQARAAVRESIEDAWAVVADGGLPTMEQRRNLAISNHLANDDAVTVVADCARLVGTSALRPEHPLARCQRDVLPLLGHLAANAQVLEFAEQVRQTGRPLAFPLV